MIAIARGDSQAGVPPVDAGESMAAAMRIAALRHRPEEAGSLANIGFGGPHKQQKLRAAANSLEEALWRPKGERARMEQDEDNPDGIPDVLKLEQPFRTLSLYRPKTRPSGARAWVLVVRCPCLK